MIFGAKPFDSSKEDLNPRIKTRNIDDNKVEVLPQVFAELDITADQFIKSLQCKKCMYIDGKFTGKGYEEISKYTLKIYYDEYERIITDNYIKIAKAKYDFENGLHTIETFLV